MKTKTLFIGGLCGVIFIMAIAYAAFATQLNINGTADITSKWDVQITGIEMASRVGLAESTSTSFNATTASFESSLLSPGDSVTYNVTVENKGTLNAKVKSITFSQDENAITKDGERIESVGTNDPIKYSYTNISENDKLPKDDSVTFQVTVAYRSDVTKQPDAEKINSDLVMTIDYVQDTE